jgi:hypothetical protein
MPIKVKCPNCGKVYTLPDRAAGKSLKCRRSECGEQFNIPKRRRANVVAAGDDKVSASGDDNFLSALGDAVHESEGAEIAELPARVERNEQSPEEIDREETTRPTRRRKRRRKRKRLGVPPLVQIAGYVFRVEVVLSFLSVCLGMLFAFGAILTSSHPSVSGAGVIVVLVVAFPLASLIALVFYRMGEGFSNGERHGVYGFIIIVGLIRTPVSVAMVLQLQKQSSWGLEEAVTFVQIVILVGLYLPAIVAAIANWHEFE